MSEEFDKELRDHITHVLDNYEHGSADAGWALLRQKYPPNNKRHPFAWWWLGAAAGLLLFSGAAFWLYKSDITKPLQVSKKMAKIKPLVADTLHLEASPDMPLEGASNAHAPGTLVIKPNSALAIAQVNEERHADGLINRADLNNNINKDRAHHTTDDNSITQARANAIHVTASSITTDTAKKQSVIASAQPSVTGKTDSATQSKKTNNPLADKTKPVQVKHKEVVWSVFASVYNNFASTSAANKNTGGGFGADIRLNRMFALSTGLGVFQNTIGYNSNSGLPLYSFSQVPSTYFSVTNYRADLLALEMPVRVNFNISKQGNYISAGINSAVFINETYHQTNNYFNSVLGSSTQSSFPATQSQDVVTEKHFKTLIFVKSIDFAAGFGYPVGNNRIIWEPFLKLPLNSLSSKAFNYGSLGFNLKFSFGANK